MNGMPKGARSYFFNKRWCTHEKINWKILNIIPVFVVVPREASQNDFRIQARPLKPVREKMMMKAKNSEQKIFKVSTVLCFSFDFHPLALASHSHYKIVQRRYWAWWKVRIINFSILCVVVLSLCVLCALLRTKIDFSTFSLVMISQPPSNSVHFNFSHPKHFLSP